MESSLLPSAWRRTLAVLAVTCASCSGGSKSSAPPPAQPAGYYSQQGASYPGSYGTPAPYGAPDGRGGYGAPPSGSPPPYGEPPGAYGQGPYVQSQPPQGYGAAAPSQGQSQGQGATTPVPWTSAPPQAPLSLPPMPQAPSPQAQASRPLLLPLVGSASYRAEIRAVMDELIAHLGDANRAKVQGIPLVFDNDPTDINAFAGCDDKGAPFMAATEGILLAIDGISQTRASDELFGTHAYEQYASIVVPPLVQTTKATAALPSGIVPLAYVADVRRLSRAHEIADEMIAFTFGHELSHHYLGHTGCAGGPPSPFAGLVSIGQLATRVVPTFNQPNEVAADNFGVIDVLDTGRARRPNYDWTEQGGLLLLDFFGKLSTASGMTPLHPMGLLLSHPNPVFRLNVVKAVAQAWYAQHPG